MTNHRFLLFVCIMELQLLNADLMETRKPAFFKDIRFCFKISKEGTELTEYRLYVKEALTTLLCDFYCISSYILWWKISDMTS